MPTNGSSSSVNESKEKPHVVINATDNNDEVDTLRSDFDTLANSFQNAVGDLKKSIADIRSSVSEIENPFNTMRTANEQVKPAAEKLPPGVKSLVLETLEQKPVKAEEPLKLEMSIPNIEDMPKEKAVALTPSPASKPIKISVYLDWIWKLLDTGLTAENIHQFADLCEMTNYLPKEASKLIYSLAVTVEKIKSMGFTKKHMLLFMYKAAALSKKNVDFEDLNALLDLTEYQTTIVKDE